MGVPDSIRRRIMHSLQCILPNLDKFINLSQFSLNLTINEENNFRYIFEVYCLRMLSDINYLLDNVSILNINNLK